MPKALREQLGFAAGTELELQAVDGHLEVVAPSRVRVEGGPYGARFTADVAEPLSAERVRLLMEWGRR